MAAGVPLARVITLIGGCIHGTSARQLMRALRALGCEVAKSRWPKTEAQMDKWGRPPIDDATAVLIVAVQYSKPGEPYRGHWFVQHRYVCYDPSDEAPVHWPQHHSATIGKVTHYLIVRRPK